MKRTINEIYEIIKQKRDNAKNDLEITLREIDDIKLIDNYGSNVVKERQLEGELNAYTSIICLIEESGVLEEENNLLNKNSRLGDIVLEQDKEIEKLNKEIEYRHKLSTEIAQEEKLKDMALKLACRRIDTLMGNEDGEYVTDPFTFKLLAKEELEKENSDESLCNKE